MSAEANVALVRDALEFAGNVPELSARYDEFMTEDFHWVPAMVGTVEGRDYRGREGFARFCSDFAASFSDVRYEIAELRAVDEQTVLALGRMRMTGHESGVPLELDSGFVFRVAGDRLAEGRSYMTHEQARAAAEATAKESHRAP